MERLRYGIHEFFYTLLAFPRAWRFMVNQRLWVGLKDYGWVARFLVFVGVLLGVTMINEIVEWFSSHENEPLAAMMIGADSLLVRLFNFMAESMSSGALNWVTLVLLEVVIYHFMRRTLQIILKKNVEKAHTFRPFFDAQLRMIKVSLLALVVQSVILGIAGIFLSGSLESLFAVGVESMLLGYAIADNYNEQFGLTIEQSARNLRMNYLGICLGLGMPLFLMLKVPVFGTILGPLVTSVAAAIVLREKSDLHIVGYQMSEKEREKENKRLAKEHKKAVRKARRKGLPMPPVPEQV
ncbi:hypothetical protein [Lewinella sp. W8]|uniref:hypothetical protein n=1 Tax=Lewinella sp. W8 TaxID=2528208 RepID=UPI0010685790|nr:hypothetical protein [Lewinella sp. W8]MTB51760.1 hypothetical protein [Lewinella sp. W8]